MNKHLLIDVGRKMTKEPVALSEWIHFLISQKHHCHAWLIGYTTFLVALFSLIMLIIFALGSTTGSLVCIPIFILFIWILYQAFDLKPVLKKSKTLLEDIMTGDITNINKIRDIWFEGKGEKKKMFKDISILAWKRIRDFTLILGIGILIIGFILMMFATGFFSMFGIQWIGSMGVAILAIGVALHSIVISKISSKEITAIANATFLELADIFEDKRIQLLQHPDWLGIEGTVWKCWTYVKRAKKLMEYAEIDDENQTEFAKQYILLTFHTGVKWENKAVKKADIKNMIKICSALLELTLKNSDKDELKGISDYFENIKK